MSYYNFLKQKQKSILRTRSYEQLLNQMLTSMFSYSNYEGILYPRTIETALRMVGYAMTTKNDEGKLVTCPCTPAELPNDNGEFIHFIGYTENGKTFTRTKGEDCVIWQNNTTATYDDQINWYSEQLAEVDKSIVNNVRFSRLLPIPLAKTNKMVEQIKDAQKCLEDGTLKIILDDNLLDGELEGVENVKLFNITDVTFSDKLQNLSMFHDDLIRRFFTLYGHNVTSNPKKAQVSVDEVNSNESFSFIVCLDNYFNRKKAVTEINEMFETNLEIDFSPTWKAQLNDFLRPADREPIEEHLEEQNGEQNGEQREEEKDNE